MDVTKILNELQQERECLEDAIRAIERLASRQGKRRGRPPAWIAALTQKRGRGRPRGSKNKTTASALNSD